MNLNLVQPKPRSNYAIKIHLYFQIDGIEGSTTECHMNTIYNELQFTLRIYISFLHIINKHQRHAVGVPTYFPFRKLWFAFCDHKNQNDKRKTATDDTILLFELGAIKSYVHFLRADIIRSIKFSIKPHSSALSNSQKRFIMRMCMFFMRCM